MTPEPAPETVNEPEGIFALPEGWITRPILDEIVQAAGVFAAEVPCRHACLHATCRLGRAIARYR